MKTRSTSREARFELLQIFRLVGAALSLGAAACAGGGDSATAAPAALSPAPQANAAQMPVEMASAPAPNASAMSGASAPSPSEGQQITGLTMPGATGSGESSPTTPAAATTGGDAAPGDATPGQGPLPAVPSAGCGRTRTLQDGAQTLASGGLDRSYFLKTPDAYDNTYPHRVVFMFHWNYGSINAIVNPPDADHNTDRPFYGLGDLTDDKTIFVVPQGLVNTGGGAGWANPNSRDVNFTDDMLAAISADLCIDTSRVFTTGFSYGAGMSVALACVRPDKFRAAIVYEPAFISGVNAGQCTKPIAFFQSHGVDDQVLNYQTGLSVLSTFTALNGCAALTPPDPPAAGHACTSYTGCSVPTRFCNFGAGENNPFNPTLRGHYPAAKDPGQDTSWVPAEAWAFINQF
jgi:predicted esterase